jgi:hypothetical protein
VYNDTLKYFHFDPPKTGELMKCVSLYQSGFVKKPTQFTIKEINTVLNTYKLPNNNYYDYSCGWGVRLLGAMNNRFNYYGTDPNTELIPRLEQMVKDYSKEIPLNTEVQFFNQGSEIFIPELENKIGISFSSPPYFILEDYKHGNQSINEYSNYKDWLEGYWRNTVKNIKRYLVDDGVFALNVKSFKEFDLLNDMRLIAEEEGFIFHESLELKVNLRVTLLKNEKINNNNEQIMVFTKSGNLIKKIEELDEW